jgi:hypothetical protein
MPAVVTPEVLQRIQYAVYQDIFNKRKPIVVDRKEMPWLSVLTKMKKTVGQNGGATTVKLKKNGGLDIQFWERRDVLGFAEPNIDLEIEFPFTNCHIGMELVHEDLFKMGYSIEPNGPRGKNFAKPMSEDDALRLVNYYEEIVEDMFDTYDIKTDQAFLRSGSYDTRAPAGLDAFISTTPTVGTYGGKSRTNELLQNQVALGLTVTAGGTLQSGLQQLKRRCNLNSRGRGGSGVNMIMVGAGFLDGYVAYAKANDWQVNTQAGGTPKLDIGIPESGYQFEGIPLVWNPTFEVLDTLETVSPLWTNRAYLLNTKTWAWASMSGMEKHFSAPMDPSDQRVSRLSLDGRYNLFCTVPNGNGVASIA